jgi:hypothetical protein
MQATRSDFAMEMDECGTKGKLAAARQRALELEQLLRTEMDRRHEEELRALLEGAQPSTSLFLFQFCPRELAPLQLNVMRRCNLIAMAGVHLDMTW